MDITIHPQKLHGCVNILPSKSHAHRLLIAAAFAKGPTRLLCPETSADIEATAACLRSLGAVIRHSFDGYTVQPIAFPPESAALFCGESGSTLRFLLPIVGALGVRGTFHMEGRLPQRPLSPLWEEMERMGCKLSRPTAKTILCEGRLRPGSYSIAGNVSSQFITGLLFALRLIPGQSDLSITEPVESRPYIEMTRRVLALFSEPDRSPGVVTVEGDWSNAAFFLAAQALGSQVQVKGLDPDSVQGDRSVQSLLPALLQQQCTIDVSHIPDLVPILGVVAALNHGAVFQNTRRLRMKESDRVESVIQMLQSLGVTAWAEENALHIEPGRLSGGTVSSFGDHRIAMAAAIAATRCSEDVCILGAECVAKSYPRFWEVYSQLGGQYEQYIR